MRARVVYEGFHLSGDSEYVRYHPTTEKFFKDHKIDFELEHKNLFNGPAVLCIVYHDTYQCNIAVETVQQMFMYSSVYDCKFIVADGSIQIQF